MKKLPTFHAPAERSDLTVIREESTILENYGYLVDIFNGMPEVAMVLNPQRQIIYANEALISLLPGNELENLLGLRPGEAIRCVHAAETEGGCGTTESCRYCGAVNAIIESMNKNSRVDMECRIVSFIEEEEVSFDFRVTARPVKIGDSGYTLVFMKDISDEKRKMALERIFFHDILNTAGGIQGFTGFLKEIDEPESMKEYVKVVDQLSHDLVDEIHAQRALILAENEDLNPGSEELNAFEMLTDVKNTVSYHVVAEKKSIVIGNPAGEYIFKSDPTLVRRVLINMLKNALEATPARGEVLLGYYNDEGAVTFYVHNDQFMPKEVQLQVFKRSFSTKGRDRGLGTYSIKLLTEKYLRGKVWFETDEKKGTSFFARLPRNQV